MRRTEPPATNRGAIMIKWNRRLKWRLLLVLLVATAAWACTSKVDQSDTIERNDLLYLKGSENPFSGIVTGTVRNEGYRNETCRFKKKYKNGRLDGRSVYYYLNGKVESIEPYQKGILNGVVTRYYESGQIKARVHFVDGLRGGSKGEMFWNENGSKRRG